MTIQWVLIASFLYFELAFIFILLLPFISPKIWQYVFYSRIFKTIASKANVYFTVLIIVLILFFLDSVREMLKYSVKTHKDYEAELQLNMKLFRSQRNYYISGFAVFLSIVIRRLIMLLVTEADLLAENEIAMKRAQSATETVQKLMKKKEETALSTNSERESALSVHNQKELLSAIKTAKFDLDCTKKALQDVEEQAKSVSAEYELLLQKHKSLLVVNGFANAKQE